MTEPVKQPTPEAYAREAEYMKALKRHSDDFDRMVEFVPEKKQEVRDAMRSLYYAEPDKLLDPEKLERLKVGNEPLFDKVVGYYVGFLKTELGLE
ncbi:MAG: hypothetical protein AAB697_02800 [Patescibacteria group bacterium]